VAGQPAGAIHVNVSDDPATEAALDAVFNDASSAEALAAPFGTQLRTFRTAVAADGEYTAAVGGGTVAGGQAAVVTAVRAPEGIDSGELVLALRDRFGMTFRLGYYEPAELASIVVRSAGILGVELEGGAAEEIAGRSRGTPRVANRILRRIRDVAEVRHTGAVTIDVAREALELLEVDEAGLEKIDRDLLTAIAHKFGGGPVGLSTLAVSLGEEPDTIEDVYEPYLLQLGFLQRTPRGRVITELGRLHIGAESAGDGLF